YIYVYICLDSFIWNSVYNLFRWPQYDFWSINYRNWQSCCVVLDLLFISERIFTTLLYLFAFVYGEYARSRLLRSYDGLVCVLVSSKKVKVWRVKVSAYHC